MEAFKEILKEEGFVPKLRLAIKEDGKPPVSTGPHRVKILEAKRGKKEKNDGTKEDAVWILVEEKGERYKYPIQLKGEDGEPHYLIQRLAEIPDGEEVILEMLNRQGRSYISVRSAEREEVADSEIPVIQEGDEIF